MDVEFKLAELEKHLQEARGGRGEMSPETLLQFCSGFEAL